MNNEHMESLVWERIDGEITAAEQAELAAHIDENPQARDLQRDIEELAERLDRLGRVAPPVGLRARITRALPGGDSGTHRPHEVETAPRTATSRRWSVDWLPMAACLLIGVTVGFLLQPGAGVTVDGSRAVGTMSVSPVDKAASVTAFDLGNGSGMFSISRDGPDAVVSLDLVTEIDLVVDLEAGEGDLTVRTVGTNHPARFEVVAERGNVRLLTRGPSNHALLLATDSSSIPVRVVVSANGSVVADQWVMGPMGSDPK